MHVALHVHQAARMSNYQHLLQLCIKVLSTFNPELTGADTHLESFLQSAESSDVSSYSIPPLSLTSYHSKDHKVKTITCIRCQSGNVHVLIYHFSCRHFGNDLEVSVHCSN